MKTLTMAAVIGTVLAASAGMAGAENGRLGHARRDVRGDWREIRQDRSEIRRDLREIHGDRRALRDAIRSGDRGAIANARRELVEDRRELRRDVAEIHRDRRAFDQGRRVDWREDRRNGPPSWAPAWGRRARDERREAWRDDQDGWRARWANWRDARWSWGDRVAFWRGWR